MYLVPGDIFYELMQLSALLYWKKRISLLYKCTLLLTYCCTLTGAFQVGSVYVGCGKKA